jgi:hypothetical protein
MEVVSRQFTEIKEMEARVVEVERMGTLREVLFRPFQGLNIGTYVKFDNGTWLIFDQWGDRESAKYKALVQKCNRTLKWQDKEGSIHELDCIASQSPLGSKASQGKQDIEWNKFDVSLPTGQLYVFVEKSNETVSFKMNQRFIFGSNVYEVKGIDDTSFVDNDGFGIIQLLVKLDVKREADNFENRIAYNDFETNVSNVNETGTVDTEVPTDTGGNIW